MNNETTEQNMAPQNSTLINLINDDVKSITSERLSPIKKEVNSCSSNDDEEEYDAEIPIFIGQVPRYVSGINRKTTCNDVIKALIDDELANTKVSKQLICEPQSYTIYERFQDSIEHALLGDELIYDLWQSWGDNRNKVQFRLKINKSREQQEVINVGKAKSKKIKNPGIQKLLKKVLHQGEMIQKHLQEMSKNQQQISEHASENSEYDEANQEFASLPTYSKRSQVLTDTEDELFLVIENHNDNDSGVFITKEQQFNQYMDFDQRKDLSITPKRKLRYSRDFYSLKDHAINSFNAQDNFTRTSCKFENVHRDVRSKVNNMKKILEQEQSFLKKIDKDKYNFEQSNYEFDEKSNDDLCDNNVTMIV